ncbi:hypothetical protein FB558_1557 [Pseudonocardia kunmingensis]|uniref:Uncharacterized protein n=1 Tax=Pseudonocardia kunmingensis TaxID=630975 RepID=A0A543DZI9_9PSEU|nr:hypothetical protein FB558_1557 [Pseudonocardia kunmingensis]
MLRHAPGRGQTGDVVGLLDRHRDTEQRPVLPAGERLVGTPGGGPRTVEVRHADRVDLLVVALDADYLLVDQLHRGHLTGTQGSRDLFGRSEITLHESDATSRPQTLDPQARGPHVLLQIPGKVTIARSEPWPSKLDPPGPRNAISRNGMDVSTERCRPRRRGARDVRHRARPVHQRSARGTAPVPTGAVDAQHPLDGPGLRGEEARGGVDAAGGDAGRRIGSARPAAPSVGLPSIPTIWCLRAIHPQGHSRIDDESSPRTSQESRRAEGPRLHHIRDCGEVVVVGRSISVV